MKVLLLVVVLTLGQASLRGEEKKAPEALSLYPLGGTPTSILGVKILGKHLQDVEHVWFDCKELQGEVRSVKLAESKEGQDEVTMEVRIGTGARVGIHVLRLYSSSGVSGPLAFNVNLEPVMEETSESNSTPATAQSVRFPSIINGRLAQEGELDFYKIDVQQGQELHAELLNSSALFGAASGSFQMPELVLYEPDPSWFGTDRHKRVEGMDESRCFVFPRWSVSIYCRARWVYQFTEPGSYVIQVGDAGAQGGPHFSYQLRILLSQAGTRERQWWSYAFAHESPFVWPERDFTAPLEADRLKKLQARSVAGVENDAEALRVVKEHSLNNKQEDAVVVELPVILEGRIEVPGDRDYYRFSAKAGERVVFELENPEKSPHYFSAKIAILDSKGEELLTNIYRRVGGDGDDWLKSIQQRTLFDAHKDGEYWVEIRDMTNQRGGKEFVYRILARPSIPHVGSVKARTLGLHGSEPEVDRINLAPGAVRRLDVISDLEEGFDGEVAISLENLPEGVQVFSGAAVTEKLSAEPGRVDEARGTIDKERYLPVRVWTTILLVASPDAPPTPNPRFIRLVARPVVKDVIGAPFPGQEVAFMVTAPSETSAATKPTTAKKEGKNLVAGTAPKQGRE